MDTFKLKNKVFYQVVISQWLAWWLATWEVPASNLGKEEKLLISNLKGNLINSNLTTILELVYELTGLV